MTTTDVVVSGAGPTGLMLACELALAGVQVRVLDRRSGQNNMTRAFAVHARTLELLDARGLADDLVPQGVPVKQVAPTPGAVLDLAEFDTPYPMVLIAPQSATEHLLEARAVRLGVQIDYGAEVVGLHQDADGVSVEASRAGAVTTERARYVVGCDGSHSAVRELVGIDFVGEHYPTHILLADVQLTEPPEEAMFARNSDEGVVLCVPFGDGWYRAIAWDRLRQQAPLDEPVTGAEMRSAFDRIAGTDFGMSEPRWSSRFLSEHRQARHYRVGRVLIAGDAAHVHSPLGGQGMNTGIGDAMNLGWKLAGVVRGWAPVSLLDSYTAERHPVGAWVLDWTRAQVALMRPEPRARALREVVIDLAATTAGATYFVKKISGVGQGYDLGPGPQIVGRSAPDLALSDGTRLADHLHDGHGLLLDLADQPKLRELGSAWPSRVRVVTADCPDEPSLAGLLVRPDGYVAWAGRNDSSDGDGETAGVDAALHTWFGPSSPGQADPYGG
jgi:2-polyprenyl-6-methoxyphenol hydroxylase-like FAD-dependent oxidoreductase